MSERDDAIRLANAVLDKPFIDPDGDICLLARQLLRETERAEAASPQWRDISTAPKTGFILCASTRDWLPEVWNAELYWASLAPDRRPNMPLQEAETLTHWYPVPASPPKPPAEVGA